MSILDIFGTRSEQQNIIGKVDCDASEVASVCVGLMGSMGMTNPSANTTTSKKGINVTKKGAKYTLTLEMFEPPFVITWSEPKSFEKISEFIDQISLQHKKIGYVNILNLSDGSKFFQFATN